MNNIEEYYQLGYRAYPKTYGLNRDSYIIKTPEDKILLIDHIFDTSSGLDTYSGGGLGLQFIDTTTVSNKDIVYLNFDNGNLEKVRELKELVRLSRICPS